MRRRQDPAWPRGLSRIEAARYVGVSPSAFDKLVAEGRMPTPKAIIPPKGDGKRPGRLVWDLHELDAAFDDLPDVNHSGPGSGASDTWADFDEQDAAGLR